MLNFLVVQIIVKFVGVNIVLKRKGLIFIPPTFVVVALKCFVVVLVVGTRTISWVICLQFRRTHNKFRININSVVLEFSVFKFILY